MFEEVLLDLRFDIGARKGEHIVITGDYVHERLQRHQTPTGLRKRDSA
jgi:ATP-dependent protease HslVU (ClpYQ) ATPase subunit